jgi:hypothetical protein
VWLQGVLEVSAVTGQLEPTYPAWKRSLFRYLVSVPVILLCLMIVFVVMIVTLQLQVRVCLQRPDSGHCPYCYRPVEKQVHCGCAAQFTGLSWAVTCGYLLLGDHGKCRN